MMENNSIKIMPNMKFGLDDLLKTVDFSHPFTLRDVFRACSNSKIPLKDLESILHCYYMEDFFKESESKPFCDKGDIEYLEIYWWGNKENYNGVKESSNAWVFHGVGILNHYSEDIIKMYKHLKKKLPKNFREKYAVEFSPMYELCDYEIRMSPKLHITDYNAETSDNDVEFVPSITLIELLYSIFWEISFCGSPKDRDNKSKEILKMAKECQKISRK